jgi:hypothetical protein
MGDVNYFLQGCLMYTLNREEVPLTTYFTSKERALLPTVWFKHVPVCTGEGSVTDITDIKTPAVELSASH